MKIRVYYEDTDAQGIIYHANYLKFCERARSEIFFSQNEKFTQGYFVLTSLEAKFIKPGTLGDILEVKTKVKEIKKASLFLEHEIYREEELLFKAEIKLAFLENDKVSKIPEKYKKLFFDKDLG